MTGDGPRPRRPRRTDDRAQAFTLEGFIASVVVLSAILFALQAVVITPSSGGQVDQEQLQQLRVEARDILTASAHNGSRDLSHHVRLFGNQSGGPTNSWELASGPQTGYGSREPFYHRDTMIGAALNETFRQRGFTYNLIVDYLSATDPNASVDPARIVYRGVPTEEAVSVTYTVVLYDNETLTGVPDPSGGCTTNKSIEEIWRGGADWDNDAGDCYFPIPEASLFDDDDNDDPSNSNLCNPADGNTDVECENNETVDSPIYNIVEVRVVVW
jgi:hypothetical protein